MRCLKASYELRIVDGSICLFIYNNKIGNSFGPYNGYKGICKLCNRYKRYICESDPYKFPNYCVYYCYKFELNLGMII